MATFPEPIKGEVNGVVMGTPSPDAAFCANVTGAAFTNGAKKPEPRTCCCISAKVLLSLFFALCIGLASGAALGFFARRQQDSQGSAALGQEADYTPVVSGYFNLKVADAAAFVAHPQAKSTLASGIASLHVGLTAEDVEISELQLELDDETEPGNSRRLQAEAQDVHVLYTITQNTLDEAKSVLQALEEIPVDSLASQLSSFVVAAGIGPILAVEDPKFCMVSGQGDKDHEDQGHLRGGRPGQEGRGDQGDGRRGGRGDADDDDDDRRLQRHGDGERRHKPGKPACSRGELAEDKKRHGDGEDEDDEKHR